MNTAEILKCWGPDFRPATLMVLDTMPADKWDFRPQVDMMSFCELALHLASAQECWRQILLSEIASWDDWPEYPAAEYPTRESVQAKLAWSHERMTVLLTERPAEWLDESVPWLDKRYRVADILTHVREHEIHHRGQLMSYLRMAGVEPPMYRPLSVLRPV